MLAPKQWLVIPQQPNVRAYLTENETVAKKRIAKGDVVEEILREKPIIDNEEEL